MNENIKDVIKALKDYESAVSKMDSEEFDTFYNVCVRNGITNTYLYDFREKLRKEIN